jgi:hypothetical protein
MDSSRIQGVTIVADILMFIAWFLAYFETMIETQYRYIARLSHYSTPLLLFWGLMFIKNNLVLISWNGSEWWFQRKTSVEEAEFILFWLNYSFSALIIFLGMKAPGLYKANYRVLVGDDDVPGTPSVSTFNFFVFVEGFQWMEILGDVCTPICKLKILGVHRI